MPANTAKGLPYPLPTEPVAEGAQAIRNLAEAVDVRLEMCRLENPPIGLTGITTTGNGDPVGNLSPKPTMEAVRYFFELTGFAATTGPTNTPLYWRLHEGTTAAVGALVCEAVMYFAAPNCAHQIAVRFPFTPAAGSRDYHLRWRGAASAQYTVGASGFQPLVARLVRA